jgi:hypothetical protein
MFFGHPSAHAVLPRTILPREKRRYFGFYRQIGAPVNMSCLGVSCRGPGMLSDGAVGIIGGNEAAGQRRYNFPSRLWRLIRAPSV